MRTILLTLVMAAGFSASATSSKVTPQQVNVVKKMVNVQSHGNYPWCSYDYECERGYTCQAGTCLPIGGPG